MTFICMKWVLTREIKQLTFGKVHAEIGRYLLPDDNILFNSTRWGSTVDCWFTEVSNMYLCDREGRYMRQVGFDQVQTVTPTLLDDGRVVYTVGTTMTADRLERNLFSR